MDNILKKRIGTKIATLLAVKDKMQLQLAEALDVTPNTVSYWCKGTRVPNVEQIIKIAEFFNVSTDYILTDIDIQTTDKDLQEICKYTGLSEKAVEFLKVLSEQTEYELDIYNHLISFLIEDLKEESYDGNDFYTCDSLLFHLKNYFISGNKNPKPIYIFPDGTVTNNETILNYMATEISSDYVIQDLLFSKLQTIIRDFKSNEAFKKYINYDSENADYSDLILSANVLKRIKPDEADEALEKIFDKSLDILSDKLAEGSENNG